MTSLSPRGITLGQFTIVFVIAGLLLAWVLLKPEMGGDLETGRTKMTMLASVLLLIPALVLYIFRDAGRPVANLSHLFWTAALVVFLVHTYWGAFIFYEGIADTFRHQGTLLAGANFALLTIWTLDTLLLWFAPGRLRHVHTGVRVLVFGLIALDLIVGRTGAAHLLGLVLVGLVVVAWLVRLATTRLQVMA